jgi:hypothetical protein
MAAFNVRKHNPVIAAFYARLVSRGSRSSRAYQIDVLEFGPGTPG